MHQLNDTNGTIHIVEAGIEHVEDIVPLFDAYRQFYQQSPNIEAARLFLTQRLTEKSATIFLALRIQDQHQIAVGFTLLYPLYSPLSLKRQWLLSDLYVVPEVRKMGCGTLLLQRAHQLAVDTNAEGLMLQTARDNTVAQALYESLGWEQETVFLTYNLFLS